MAIDVREDVPLAPRTTLRIGGVARYFCETTTADEVRQALAWAEQRDLALHVIGGGSNLLVADRGVHGLVMRHRDDAITALDDRTVDVAAGCTWDRYVAWTVERDLAGVECLSGIPGDMGAAPIQNIGAYGQELGETLVSVTAVERSTGELVTLSHAECELAYRDSVFKRAALGRYILVGVQCKLVPGGAPKIAYAELQRATENEPKTVKRIREIVIALRRNKSMVLDETDENRRSAGSFFVNPTVANEKVDAVRARAEALAPGQPMPAFPAGPDRTKLSAAWMIDRAGLKKGTRRGNVGISSKHTLGLINRGGATASELIAFAIEVKRTVHDAFGVTLHPEPRMVGFEPSELAVLLEA